MVQCVLRTGWRFEDWSEDGWDGYACGGEVAKGAGADTRIRFDLISECLMMPIERGFPVWREFETYCQSIPISSERNESGLVSRYEFMLFNASIAEPVVCQ